MAGMDTDSRVGQTDSSRDKQGSGDHHVAGQEYRRDKKVTATERNSRNTQRFYHSFIGHCSKARLLIIQTTE